MATQISLAKGGYYPFPAEYLPSIAGLFNVAPSWGEERPRARLLDPCAGEGEALQILATHLKMQPYAIELEEGRAATCKRIFGEKRALHEDMFKADIEPGSMQMVWMNPPFTMDTAGSLRRRREFDMLQHAWRWVDSDGYMVFISYAHHLTLDLLSWVGRRSSDMALFRLPELHMGLYVYTVLVATKSYSDSSGLDHKAIQAFYAQAQSPDKITHLLPPSQPFTSLPSAGSNKKLLSIRLALTPLRKFAPMPSNQRKLLAALRDNGAERTDTFQMAVTPRTKTDLDIRPVTRPKLGHMLTLMAAGMFNNLRLETSRGPALLRSTVRQVEELVDTKTTGIQGKTETWIKRPKAIITLLHADGRVDDISDDASLAAFIGQHREVLLAYVEERYKPRYEITGDHPAKRRWLPYMREQRVKGKHPLFPAQQHVAAAMCATLKQRRSVLLAGEMGSGKTPITLSVLDAWHKDRLANRERHKAAAWAQKPLKGEAALIVCPAIMVRKWAREAQQQHPHAHVVALRNDHTLGDFAAAMRHLDANPTQIHIIVASQDAIKPGEGFIAAYTARRGKITCPTTGEPVKNDDGEPAQIEYLEGHKRFHGSYPLWQEVRQIRVKAAMKAGKPHPLASRQWWAGRGVPAVRSPRLPLWRLVKARYRYRIGIMVIDEAHQSKSIESDRYASVSALARYSKKLIGLSGTIFNGRASSLYGIETIFNPALFEMYPWGKGGVDQFSRDMGVIEKIIEYKEEFTSTGTYSGVKRIAHGAKERPGVSPLLIQMVLDHTVFLSITDLGKALPELEEVPQVLQMSPAQLSEYRKGEAALKAHLQDCRTVGDSSFLGAYYQSLLAYPDTAGAEMRVVHARTVKNEWGKITARIDTHVHTFGAVQANLPKEDWLVEAVRAEVAQGRGVGVFVTQSDTRDIQPRIAELLTNAGLKVAVLTKAVKPVDREAWVTKQFEQGAQVLISNPRLIEVGLDILQCPTLIFLSPDPQLAVMAQASRRHWRITQTQPCKTYFVCYDDTMEYRLTGLMADKFKALDVINGEKASLSALNNTDLLSELMATNVVVRDLKAEFAIINRRTFDDSAWIDQDEPAPPPQESMAKIAPPALLVLQALPQLEDNPEQRTRQLRLL